MGRGSLSDHGFVRVAAAVPRLQVADPGYNADRILELLARGEAEGAAVLVFPELCLTGYTCADLFQHSALLGRALAALARVAENSGAVFSGLAVVGLPLQLDGALFNVAALVHGGKVLGFVPKSYIPNYKEFYERRWFAPGGLAKSRAITFAGGLVPFGSDLLFAAENYPDLVVGVEICEDLWVPSPPSSRQALAGGTVLVNLSASNEVIGKAAYRRQLVADQSGRCIAGYVYCSSGVSESSTDLVFGGHCLIGENGTILAESERFRREATLLAADVDLARLHADRIRTNSFADNRQGEERSAFRMVPFRHQPAGGGKVLCRMVEAHPFVPQGQAQLRERCEEIFHTQVAGLARRLEQIGQPRTAIGVSGGLDSTLALLVACKTMDALAAPRDRIQAITMPGFGTTGRTLGNARSLMKELAVTAREVDIRHLCLEELRQLGHRPFGIDLAGLTVEAFTARLQQLRPENRNDLVFENVQARMRMNLLMNAGFVIGTGDVSELALGWTTYNGDHMSMYNPNVSIPKTLVKFLVRWAAENEFSGEARRVLLDIAATEISPELLPTAADGQGTQRTEGVIGPYELHDFFLFHFLRYGATPERILFLAAQARFDREYSPEEIRRWLRVFFERFFANQFKRSCLPDGPKVGTISLSPRGDWRMPSDAQAALWLAGLGEA